MLFPSLEHSGILLNRLLGCGGVNSGNTNVEKCLAMKPQRVHVVNDNSLQPRGSSYKLNYYSGNSNKTLAKIHGLYGGASCV